MVVGVPLHLQGGGGSPRSPAPRSLLLSCTEAGPTRWHHLLPIFVIITMVITMSVAVFIPMVLAMVIAMVLALVLVMVISMIVTMVIPMASSMPSTADGGNG